MNFYKLNFVRCTFLVKFVRCTCGSIFLLFFPILYFKKYTSCVFTFIQINVESDYATFLTNAYKLSLCEVSKETNRRFFCFKLS